MTVLVTGATGFLGRYIVRALGGSGTTYVPLSRSDANDGVCIDLAAPGQASLPSDLSAVIHCASVIPAAGETDFGANVSMTRNLLDLLSATVETFVLISSVSVYCTEQAVDGLLSEDLRDFSTSPYGASKRQQEELCQDWAAVNDVRLVILRPSSIFGPGQRSNTLLPRICEAALRDKAIPVFAPPGYRQNFVSVHDVAELAANAVSGGMSGTFNAFSDDTLSALQLAERIVGLTESGSEIQHDPSKDNVAPLVFPNSKIKKTFGHEFRPLDDGIRELAAHMTSVCHG